MKLLSTLNLLFIVITISSVTLVGQQKATGDIKKTKQGDRYVKDCSSVTAGFEECILCKDKELTQCNKYYCSGGICEMVFIKTAIVRSISESIGVDKIPNVKTDELASGVEVHYVEDGKYRAYVLKEENGYKLFVYEVTTAKNSISNNEKCEKICKPKSVSCMESCNGDQDCINKCIEESILCIARCRSYLLRSSYSIPSDKPINTKLGKF